METDFTLPESIESERLILSNLLCDKHGEAFECCSKLKPHHFLTRSHAIIFDSMLKLHQESKATDLVTVTDALISNGKIQEIGGHNELNKLFSSHLTIGHTSQHVEILMEKYRLRKLIDICESSKISAVNNQDSSDCISKLEMELFGLCTDKNENDNQLQSAYEDVKRMIEVRKNNKDITGLLSGIPAFDDAFFGFQKAQYYVVAGRPSSGKTAFADQVCVNLLKDNKPVLYISLESDRERVMSKLACKLASVSYWDFKRNRIAPSDLLKVERMNETLKDKPLILMRPFDISPMEVRPLIRRCKRKHDIELIIIDYLQKINIPSGWDERRTVSRGSTEIQRACIETGVPALVVAQLNREAQGTTRPSMSNLKESGQIEQDADNIAMIWSDTDKRDLSEGSVYHPCSMSIEKNKDGASSVDLEMNFHMKNMIFSQRKGII